MLLNFGCKNFRSFRDKVVLNMQPNRSKVLDYSILKNGKCSALSTTIIYGANASGKSNLLKALATLKKLIILGNTKNFSNDANNFIIDTLPMDKNIFADKNEAINFEIEFISNSEHYEYALSINVDFYNGNNDARVEYEKLEINGKQVFERCENNILGIEEAVMYENGMQGEDLFLCNGYKIINLNAYKSIINWFSEKLFIVLNMENFAYKKVDAGLIENGFMQEIARAAGTCATINEFKKEGKVLPFSVISTEQGEEMLPSVLFESLGTMKLINFMPYLREWFVDGATVLIDEFDSSLHPSAVINIVNIFHNNEININNAQLIFTTHNPIYLDANIFRNDEICIVDNDENRSIMLKISEINNTRITKKTSLLNKYMKNELGGDQDIDFSDLFMITTN